MKICVQTAPLLSKFGVDKAFEMIKQAGFDGVDFNIDSFYPWAEIKTLRPLEILTVPEKFDAFCKEVITASEKYGIEIHQVHAPFPTCIPDMPEAEKNMLDTVIKSAEFCGRVGCGLLVVHPRFIGNARFPSNRAQEWEMNMSLYSALIPYLKKYGVTCCLENMWSWDSKGKKIYFASCSDMTESNKYIDTLNGLAGAECFGFCLDIGHLLILGIDTYNAVETLGSRLKTLHIHDNDGVSDQHVCPYMGIGNWERFCLALKTFGYNGALSFETGNVQNTMPEELWLPSLTFTAEVGKYLDRQING